MAFCKHLFRVLGTNEINGNLETALKDWVGFALITMDKVIFILIQIHAKIEVASNSQDLLPIEIAISFYLLLWKITDLPTFNSF